MKAREKIAEEIAADNQAHNRQQPIGWLPRDLKQNLCAQYLDGADGYNLLRAAPGLFQPALPVISQKLAASLRPLLSHVALGEWEQAEAIWRNNPSLLTTPGTVYHPNRFYVEGQDPVDIPEEMSLGRYKYVNCTAWQIALMNEEYEEADLMGQFMSEEEKEKQFLEIFPDGKMQYSQKLEDAKILLQQVFDAVIKDQTIVEDNLEKMGDATKDALKALRDYIKPAPEHRSGLVFNPAIYQAALQIYDDNFNKFQNWDQRSFWCIRVEEMIASVLGTGYLRPHAQGVGRNAHHRRGCLLSDGSSYFAFRRNVNSLAGLNFFVGYLQRREWVVGRAGWAAACRFKNYVKQKQEKGRIYAEVFARKNVGVCDLLK